MNTDQRKNAKNDFENEFLKLVNKLVFAETIENVRKHRDIRIVATDRTKLL